MLPPVQTRGRPFLLFSLWPRLGASQFSNDGVVENDRCVVVSVVMGGPMNVIGLRGGRGDRLAYERTGVIRVTRPVTVGYSKRKVSGASSCMLWNLKLLHVEGC